MFDTSAPVLKVNHAYLIGESQRGLLITNDVTIVPVMTFMNMGDLTESVSLRGAVYDDMAGFLNKVHAGQIHVGDVLMFNGRSRADLNQGLASLYQVNTWPVLCTGCFMSMAQGFMLTMLRITAETFESSFRRELPMVHHYQLCWVDRDGRHHAFTDIVEVN
jgi:hypothetical protein